MDLISSTEAAEIIGVSNVTLYKWRKADTGPSWVEQPGIGRGGRRVLYSRKECINFARFRAIEARLAALEAGRR